MSIHSKRFSPVSRPNAFPKFSMSKFALYLVSVNFLTISIGSLSRAIPAATIAPADVPANILALSSCPAFLRT
ncbi:hypothetical protein ATCV1_z613L [Acanthocystis turfacea chlorella virus 1]|uniref:Uncharacterized protein z613L n=1 Tax=Chlorovirus heliozoae TaxID=322019 RepID=A7K9M3_9PHYC|nr:hypothetical protein ATCV1_z613L [Acanthocystis turfacea chlorella virus 1]ABT16747.1 hypothetical protein ATCV1_z613L [Acanthocystis turfacea chlorella virus 1]